MDEWSSVVKTIYRRENESNSKIGVAVRGENTGIAGKDPDKVKLKRQNLKHGQYLKRINFREVGRNERDLRNIYAESASATHFSFVVA